ncbi:hypothetical protein BJ912DRAFT_491128 [Pholiota molesta]|nr:hypothetical protein BJ912DRAFT_491128 [Pholiota molesta]
MMLYHDGLRISLPKMPATAQFFGHPHLISPHLLFYASMLMIFIDSCILGSPYDDVLMGSSAAVNFVATYVCSSLTLGRIMILFVNLSHE